MNVESSEDFLYDLKGVAFGRAGADCGRSLRSRPRRRHEHRGIASSRAAGHFACVRMPGLRPRRPLGETL
jgi:hypothetical protein